MKLPLELVFREMLPLPSLEPEIRRRAAKLEQWGGELISCRVVIEGTGNQHRQGHEYQVTVDVRVPDGELVVNHHRGADAPLALRAAFDAMDRRLDERARRRRGDVKRHDEVPPKRAP